MSESAGPPGVKSAPQGSRRDRPGDIGFPALRPDVVVKAVEAVEAVDKGPPNDLPQSTQRKARGKGSVFSVPSVASRCGVAVDCRELRGHFIVPELGERVRWASYDAPRWELTGVSELRAARPAVVHEVKGVEIEVTDRDRENDWKPERWTMYGRLTEETAEWLAVVNLAGDAKRIYTFLDEGFEDDWGRMRRRLADTGGLVRGPDGSYARKRGETEDVGAGVFSVKVGGKGFTCLRVIDIQGDPDDEHGILREEFITRSGRTALSRRYNATRWDRRPGKRAHYGSAPTWEEELPDAARLVVDGITFVHWYDSLSGAACGLAW